MKEPRLEDYTHEGTKGEQKYLMDLDEFRKTNMKEEKNLPTKLEPKEGSIYANMAAFEDGQRIAKALSSAGLVPEVYRNNIPNTMIALEMANRIGVSPIMVMQNLHVIQGKPSWSSSFIIAALNSCGRFTPLRFVFEGKKETDEYGCRAVAKDRSTGDTITGTLITWKMVKAEGWFSKKDKHGNETSKWQTMSEQMFQYRAAAFFGRVYAPDILSGMHSAEETLDIQYTEVKQSPEESDVDKEGAVFNFIKSCKNVDDLETAAGQLITEELKNLYAKRMEQLKKKENK